MILYEAGWERSGLDISFSKAATAACVGAERAIASAEERLAKRYNERLALAIDRVYELVASLSDRLGDIAAAAELAPNLHDDERKEAGARRTYHLLLLSTGLLLALNAE